jgi:hypothetical protein
MVSTGRRNRESDFPLRISIFEFPVASFKGRILDGSQNGAGVILDGEVTTDGRRLDFSPWRERAGLLALPLQALVAVF